MTPLSATVVVGPTSRDGYMWKLLSSLGENISLSLSLSLSSSVFETETSLLSGLTPYSVFFLSLFFATHIVGICFHFDFYKLA
jgi:hypothetical protein